jgi:hypothetical protein
MAESRLLMVEESAKMRNKFFFPLLLAFLWTASNLGHTAFFSTSH